MSQLILIDKESHVEIGRQPMHANDRHQLYHDCAEHEPLCFQGKCYVIHTVAWQVPELDCVIRVTFQSHAEPVYLDD